MEETLQALGGKTARKESEVTAREQRKFALYKSALRKLSMVGVPVADQPEMARRQRRVDVRFGIVPASMYRSLGYKLEKHE